MIRIIFLLLLWPLLGFGAIVSNDWQIAWNPGVRFPIPYRQTISATISPGASAATIQAALDACPSNQVVLLQDGTYTVDDDIIVPSWVTFRGTSISNTIVKSGTGNGIGSRIVLFGHQFNYELNETGGRTNDLTTNSVLLAPVLKGSINVTSLVVHGYSIGDRILIDTKTNNFGNPPVENRGTIGFATWVGRPISTNKVDGVNVGGQFPMGQFCTITNIPSATVFQTDPPMYWYYTNEPTATKITGWTEGAGIENMTLDNSVNGTARDTLVWQGVQNCWADNVMLIGAKRRAHWVYAAYWSTFRRSIVRGGTPLQGDNGSSFKSDRSYGVFWGPWVTACLWEDNIFSELTSAIALEGCAAGNVWTANVDTNIFWEQQSDYPRRFGILMHGPHPFMNLFEFNHSAERVRADEYWGTSSHWTFLRNVILQHDRGTPFSQSWTVDIERRNDYYAFVGNILGGFGGVQEDNYEYINNELNPYLSVDGAKPTIWKIGYPSLGGGGTSNYSTATLSRTLRWGNWCYRTNDSFAGSGITYHTENVVNVSDFVIPVSYWRPNKPVDWGDLPYPPYDPSNPFASGRERIPAGFYMANGRWPDVRTAGQALIGIANPVGARNRNIPPRIIR